jgi:hypothetical protein
VLVERVQDLLVLIQLLRGVTLALGALAEDIYCGYAALSVEVAYRSDGLIELLPPM